MRKCIYAVLILLFCFVACRERNNMFDVGYEGYTSPPYFVFSEPIDADYHNGELIGVLMAVVFEDTFTTDLVMSHGFYENDSMVIEFGFEIPQGTMAYGVWMYGPYTIADYCMKIHFGGMPMGACPFRVDSLTNRLFVEDLSNDTTIGYTYPQVLYIVNW